MMVTTVLLILAVLKLDAIPTLSAAMITTPVLLMDVILKKDVIITLLIAMTTMSVPKIVAILKRVVFTMKSAVMIMMNVLWITVTNTLDANTTIKSVRMKTYVPEIYVVKIVDVTLPLSAAMITTPVL